jgi:hypothetical protein
MLLASYSFLLLATSLFGTAAGLVAPAASGRVYPGDPGRPNVLAVHGLKGANITTHQCEKLFKKAWKIYGKPQTPKKCVIPFEFEVATELEVLPIPDVCMIPV